MKKTLSVFSFVALSFLLINCVTTNKVVTVKGNGKVQKKTFSLNNFDSINLGGEWKIDIKQDSAFLVEVEADENLFDHFDINILGNTLNVKIKKGSAVSSKKCALYITMPFLKSLKSDGAIKGKIKDFNKTDGKMMLASSGSADIEGENLNLKDLDITISGSGTITPKGKGANMKLNISGSANIKAKEFETENAEIDLSGTGDAQVWVKGNLKVNLSGTGLVRYKGSPNIEKNISGTGSVEAF